MKLEINEDERLGTEYRCRGSKPDAPCYVVPEPCEVCGVHVCHFHKYGPGSVCFPCHDAFKAAKVRKESR